MVHAKRWVIPLDVSCEFYATSREMSYAVYHWPHFMWGETFRGTSRATTHGTCYETAR